MRRRDFIILLGPMGGWASAVRAQQKAMPVIGFLGSTSPGGLSAPPLLAAFLQGLSEIGYVEGQNVTIEWRWAEGHYDRLPALAADLVGHRVDVIVTGTTPAALAAKGATSTIPIVFNSTDPVGQGLVASLARPGGNLTGYSPFGTELMPKRIELLSELVPQARVIAFLTNPNFPTIEGFVRDVQEAARTKGIQLPIVKAAAEGDIDAAFGSLVELHADALLVDGAVFFNSHRDRLVALASRHTVPAIYPWREATVAGGVISYGTSITGIRHQVGIYVARILKGTTPADLPVQQPTTFELVVNLKTAKELGITVPPLILARADEVLE